MARNDIVLLDSLVEKSISQLGEEKDASEIFELFSLDQLLKDYDNFTLPAEMQYRFGTMGYNEAAAKSAWIEVTNFLHK